MLTGLHNVFITEIILLVFPFPVYTGSSNLACFVSVQQTDEDDYWPHSADKETDISNL